MFNRPRFDRGRRPTGDGGWDVKKGLEKGPAEDGDSRGI